MSDAVTADMADPDASTTSAGKGRSDTATDRRVYRAATVLTIVPIVAAAVRNGLSGWFPTHDAGMTTIWVRDVFSANPPLHAQPMRFPKGQTEWPHYLGIIHHYVLAVPVRLFGVSWGILLGMMLLGICWVLLAAWLLRRRVGPRVGLVGCTVLVALQWSLGSQLLIDPTPVQTGTLALFAFCVAAWSAADGDPRSPIPLALTANYLFLVHPQFVLIVPATVVVVMSVWFLRTRGHRPGRVAAHPPGRRDVIGAAMVTVLCWLPTMIDMLPGHDGNLRIWISSMLDQSNMSDHKLFDVVRVVTSPLTDRPFWLRDSITHPAFTYTRLRGSVTHAVIALAILGTIVLATVVVARRRRDTTVVTGITVGLVVWAAWVTTLYRQPGRNFVYTLASWPIAAYITMIVAIGVGRAIGARAVIDVPAARATVMGVLFAAMIVLVVASLPLSDFGSTTSRTDVTAANDIRRAIKRQVEPGSPVLVDASGYPPRGYTAAAIIALEDKGIAARVPAGRESMLYRSTRQLDPDHPDAGRRLTLTSDPLAGPDGARIITASCPGLHETLTRHITRLEFLTEWFGTGDAPRLRTTATSEPDVVADVDSLLAAIHDDPRTAFDDLETIDQLILLDGGLAGSTAAGLATAIGVPGTTNTALREWLADRHRLLRSGCAYIVFLSEE